MSDQPVRYWVETNDLYDFPEAKDSRTEMVAASAFDAQSKECERLREALNSALSLASVPEHAQDQEWQTEYERLCALFKHHGAKGVGDGK